MLTINFKRGDTFRLQGTYKVDGVAAALPQGIKAQLRDASTTDYGTYLILIAPP